jgi:hypothetical protein
MAGAMGGAGGATSMAPQDMQQSVATAFGGVAQTMSDSATALSSTPPPGFENGEEAAGKMIAALQGFSAALAQAGSDLAAASITTQEEFDAKMQEISDQLDAAGDGINQALGGGEDVIPADVQAAAEQLPACSFMSEGDSGATTTTS